MASTSNITAEGEREIREMLLFVVRSLVDHPDQTEIVLVSDPEGSIFCIHTHPRDVANLTGNGGQIERALSCIIVGSGRKIGRRLTIDIVHEASRSR
jgi:predicted RNA-binding protein YlqC (UPF0109 family)